MDIDDLIFVGKEKDQKLLKQRLKENIPLEDIIPIYDGEIKNEYYVSLVHADHHGMHMKMTPRFEIRGVSYDDVNARDIKNAPFRAGRDKGYMGYTITVRKNEETGIYEFYMHNPMGGTELVIRFK